jgi:pre-rRNA-processing protein TSR2
MAARHPDHLMNFKIGIQSMFRQWTALSLAVHNQWGGPASAQHADNLVQSMIDLFNTPERIFKDDVSLILDDVMETNFNTICEDESTDELGQIICDMFYQCTTGDLTIVTRTLNQEKARSSGNFMARSQGIERGDEIGDDEDDDMDDITSNNTEANAMFQAALATANDSLFSFATTSNSGIPAPRPAAAAAEEDAMETSESKEKVSNVDADGWETVVKTKKKR